MNNYDLHLSQLREQLPIGESFDILERKISVGERNASMFFADGLTDGKSMQYILSFLLKVTKEDIEKSTTSKEFLKYNMPYLDTMTEHHVDMALKHLYSGLMVMVIDGMDEFIITDVRDYPARGVEEPAKEKSLRGAKDGFTESLMTNVTLIRRRIRDNNLIFKGFIVGENSKSDVCLAYMKGKAEQSIVDRISKSLQQLKIPATTVGEQTLVEALSKSDDLRHGRRQGWINPFPKVRYSQRPDVISAHITEGKIALIVDNSPTVILIPVGVFDFAQDVDDFYFPVITGNYFRLLRIMNTLSVSFLIPAYLLISQGDIPVPIQMEFFVPSTDYAIPLFWQFIILEIAVDALKLASLNTPESLGMSLSVIGALILGDFSVSSGWFIPQTILCMAIVALASFMQPSIELGYGIKFGRILTLIGAYVGGVWGAIVALAIGLTIMGTTKTLVGTSYFYPLIPFNKAAAKKVFFRNKV